MRLFALTMALAGLLGLAVPGAVTAAGDDARDELVIGITQFPSTLNPNINSMVAKSYVLGMTQRPFTAYDHDWELACFLCTGLPTFENGLAVREPLPEGVEGHGEREGVALTYTIQPDATWGDGTPVTTDDVLFTYEVGKHPESGISNAELYRRILGSTSSTRGPSRPCRPDHVQLQRHQRFPRPAGASGAGGLRRSREYRNRTTFDTDPTNPGLWFGPYRVSEVSSGAHIALEANPTWWGSEPHFKRIVVKVIENTAALEANLLSGAIDMIAGELGLTLDQALAFEQRNSDGSASTTSRGCSTSTSTSISTIRSSPTCGCARR